ncbi:hypothetical protein CORMATOL_02670 [Corynebacterium matruchotii ATCC 33806]|uniref:Uncharacterized protein n=1 Tax=Corynebacterium matruchotii ATCC 33806 TaxID=566549 RepID=C0E6N4_9CORY|nr:hypothetical protein CORMATOL_02670 [Corynebacterium matruchotii ATCC 33806]
MSNDETYSILLRLGMPFRAWICSLSCQNSSKLFPGVEEKHMIRFG